MKKVLIISYYFPPSGGPGVQRILKFVKYLRDFDWEPVVLTVEKGAFPNIDESLVDQIPPDTKIIRTKALNPFGIYAKFSGVQQAKAASVGLLSNRKLTFREKMARWIRANIFIPDARIGWYPYAYRTGKHYIKKNAVDVIVSSGPPHSVHVTGLKLHRKTGIPWIADFRDPWTDISFFDDLPMIGFVRKLHERMEKKVLKNASAISVVSPSWKKLLQLKTGNQFEVIYNGYDEDDFADLQTQKNEKFIISHIGNLYGSRNPEQFWEALNYLINEKYMRRINVRLIGNVDTSIIASIAKYDLDAFVSIIPYLQYKEGLARMADSSLLLLIIEPWEASPGMIPGKLYEYLVSRRPVLGIGPTDGDAANILNECNAGAMCQWQNKEAIAGYIEQLYNRWEQSGDTRIKENPNILSYTRKNQTAKLASLLNRLYEQKEKKTATTTT